MNSAIITCTKTDCRGNKNGMCDVLTDSIEGRCPFYKTKARECLEQGDLNAVPMPDWKAYRLHSGIGPVSQEDIAEWLAELEHIMPTKSPETKKIVSEFLEYMGAVLPKRLVIDKIVDWLRSHPEGCGWAMSPEETAELILEREVGSEGNEDEQSDIGQG